MLEVLTSMKGEAHSHADADASDIHALVQRV